MFKKLFKSRTTQNVAAGTAASTGVVAGVLALLRSFAPDILPWPAELDLKIDMLLVMILGPLCSRWFAKWRNPEKAHRASAGLSRNKTPMIVFFLIAGLAAGGVGCQTRSIAPDGTVTTTSPDIEALVAVGQIIQLCGDLATPYVREYLALKADRDAADDANDLVERDRLQSALEEFLALILSPQLGTTGSEVPDAVIVP